MEKKILFISSGRSFMVNAMDENLQGAGYQIQHVAPTVEEISQHQDDADLIVFYLGKFVGEILKTLVYLRDLCTEQEKLLVLIGNPVEISTVEEQIPAGLVAASYERPLDIKKLVSGIDRLIDVNDDRARRKNILLVDDDGAFLKIIREWLSAEYRVTIVSSGAQALMYVADNKPDLILLDYDMPVTSGPQVLEMLRSERKVDGIPVIFLTGKGDRESVMQVLSMKPDGYLLKSMERTKLLSAIEDFFEKQKYKTITCE